MDIYKNYFNEIVLKIKKDIKDTQTNTMYQVNSNLIMLYFRIGKILYENSKYGNNLIKNVASVINTEYPGRQGFSERNLKRMKRFYKEYKNDNQKVPPVVAQLFI